MTVSDRDPIQYLLEKKKKILEELKRIEVSILVLEGTVSLDDLINRDTGQRTVLPELKRKESPDRGNACTLVLRNFPDELNLTRDDMILLPVLGTLKSWTLYNALKLLTVEGFLTKVSRRHYTLSQKGREWKSKNT